MHHTESKPRWWHSDYNVREKIRFFHYRLVRPRERESFSIGRRLHYGTTVVNDIEPNFSLLILGDYMPHPGLELRLASNLCELIEDSDLVLLHIEGIMSEKKRLLALNHEYSLPMEVRRLFGTKVILNLVNNHASDFGKDAFLHQPVRWRKEGFEHLIWDQSGEDLTHGIHFYAASYWCNQRIDTVPRFDYHTLPQQTPNPDTFNIFLPHWGYEMELHPQACQVEYAYHLLDNGWDAVIGSHPHCPQPMELRESKPIVYSLGNFCYKNINPNHWGGRAIRLHFHCEPNLKPILCSMESYFTLQTISKEELLISLESSIDYKDLRADFRWSLSYFRDLLT